GYLNKYDTKLYVYDSLNKPVNNEDSKSYDDLNTIMTVNSTEAHTPGLYYYEKSSDQFTYITRRDVVDTAKNRIGSLVIISNPKKYSSDALFPELFKLNKGTDPENSSIYSTAIYENRKLVTSSNKYPFPISLRPNELPNDEFEKRVNGDYDE